MPEEAARIACIMATGRSDYPNQINNVLAFPGIFRGALDVRATPITESMKLAAAHAIAGCIAPRELSAEYIVPSVFNRQVVQRVAAAVQRAAIKGRRRPQAEARIGARLKQRVRGHFVLHFVHHFVLRLSPRE